MSTVMGAEGGGFVSPSLHTPFILVSTAANCISDSQHETSRLHQVTSVSLCHQFTTELLVKLLGMLSDHYHNAFQLSI